MTLNSNQWTTLGKIIVDAMKDIEAKKKAAQAQEEERLRQERERKLAETEKNMRRALLCADTERNGFPPLPENLLDDPLRGHWDLWGADQPEGLRLNGKCLKARDPAGDLQRGVPVCIDFGTSSTVVAFRENGRKRLLRVGVRDWNAPARAGDFENPTALEFIDVAAFAHVWNAEHWRPRISWKDLKCARQARDDVTRVSPVAIINSVVNDLKTWARDAAPFATRDQKDRKFALATPGTEVRAGDSAAIDPLAVYAFHLGLAINNQYRGNGQIYHEYYLSFPAVFDGPTRERIRASFALGLERSLPESLGRQSAWREIAPFVVREGVEEPAAYAVAALAESGVEPDERGVAFGVFDFGGGTTDFAFGTYRLATPEEEETRGWERVIRLLDVSGDKDLGGEALLRELAFGVVSDNAAAVLAQNVSFAFSGPARPIPAGMERVFADGFVARANAGRLAETLRPLWEEGPEAFDVENEGLVHLRVQDGNGVDRDLALVVDKEKALAWLRERILVGVEAFFVAFRQAFKRHRVGPGEKLHIFPAGNSCRSPLVRPCFDEYLATLAREENFKTDHFLVHDLPLPDDSNPEALTLKTGVALGLLDTVPGETVGVCREESANAGFRYAFGAFRRGKLEPALNRFSALGEWTSLGRARADLRLVVGWSSSPAALEGWLNRGDPECREQNLAFNQGDAGRTIFARAVGQDTVEIALGDGDAVDETSIRVLKLEE